MHWMLSTWLLLNTQKALGKSYYMVQYIQSGMICSLALLFSFIHKEPVKAGVLLVCHSSPMCTVKLKHVRLGILLIFCLRDLSVFKTNPCACLLFQYLSFCIVLMVFSPIYISLYFFSYVTLQVEK